MILFFIQSHGHTCRLVRQTNSCMCMYVYREDNCARQAVVVAAATHARTHASPANLPKHKMYHTHTAQINIFNIS